MTIRNCCSDLANALLWEILFRCDLSFPSFYDQAALPQEVELKNGIQRRMIFRYVLNIY